MMGGNTSTGGSKIPSLGSSSGGGAKQAPPLQQVPQAAGGNVNPPKLESGNLAPIPQPNTDKASTPQPGASVNPTSMMGQIAQGAKKVWDTVSNPIMNVSPIGMMFQGAKALGQKFQGQPTPAPAPAPAQPTPGSPIQAKLESMKQQYLNPSNTQQSLMGGAAGQAAQAGGVDPAVVQHMIDWQPSQPGEVHPLVQFMKNNQVGSPEQQDQMAANLQILMQKIRDNQALMGGLQGLQAAQGAQGGDLQSVIQRMYDAQTQPR